MVTRLQESDRGGEGRLSFASRRFLGVLGTEQRVKEGSQSQHKHRIVRKYLHAGREFLQQ